MTSLLPANDSYSDRNSYSKYPKSLSAGFSSSSAARTGLNAPAIGDAFADVFQMIASMEGPPPADAPAEVSPPASNEPVASDAVKTETNSDDDASDPNQAAAVTAAAAVLTETEAESDEPDSDVVATKTPEDAAATASKPATELTAEPDADADQASDQQSAAANVEESAVLDSEPTTDDGSGDQPTIAEASAAAAATPLAADPATSSNPSETTTPVADATTTKAVTNGPTVEAASDSEPGDSESDEPVLARYAGDPQDASDDKSSGSRRRLRGQARGQQGRGEAVQGEFAGGESTPRELPPAVRPQTVAATATPDAAAGGIDISGMNPVHPAVAEPSAAAVALPTATPLPAATAAAGASAATKSSLSASGGESTAAPRTVTDPTVGAESTSSKDIRATTAGKEANEGPRVADRALLVQRVSRAFQRLGVDGGQVRIRLHPEELGGVQLQLNMQGQRMSGRVVTETEAARSILTQHLPELRQRLADQGMQVERLEVQLEGEQDAGGEMDLPNRDSAGQGRAGQGREGQDERTGFRGTRRPAAASTSSPESSTAAPQRHATSARSVVQAAQQKSVDLFG
ncbi:flagellar hook-length control protein FliK [Roseimaritima ulvae]|uniref:Flagellar hook-length control protein FliK n=1 Tax=Roseimaritima ulvae TaxID=980254 RepID=A0A5B9QUK8_9BACT|nr:flagellar hook-length control protein FliK [Roseimaritima ulvae]QEG42737.1 Flagellar hook-length control protein FliK [Roseimaritima ulvae]